MKFTDMKKIFYGIRILTVAPLMALFLILSLRLGESGVFQTAGEIGGGIAFLVLLPLAAYPLQPLFPRFKDKGRKGQRELAMLFAVLGYVCGMVFCLFCSGVGGELIVYACYLLSGLIVLFCNRVLRLKVSGHACGITVPLLFVIRYAVLPGIVIGAVLFAAVCFSGVATGRHSPLQLLGGSLVGCAVSLLLFIPV